MQIHLHDGTIIPQLGFGVWQISNSDAEAAVTTALKTGYRHIDTAAIYENEAGVGQALKKTHLARSEVFVTTKLWNSDQGYDSAIKACEHSLMKLGLDYVDLYLVHWPAPKQNQYIESWQALIELQKRGLVKAIGVSNFNAEHLDAIIKATNHVPVLNQVELHPEFQQRELRQYHKQHAIATQAWSPLGQGQLITHPVINQIALKYGKTPAQVIIRWHLQQGIIAIPKSQTPSRIKENYDALLFGLSPEDMQAINELDKADGKIGPDPLTADF